MIGVLELNSVDVTTYWSFVLYNYNGFMIASITGERDEAMRRNYNTGIESRCSGFRFCGHLIVAKKLRKLSTRFDENVLEG